MLLYYFGIRSFFFSPLATPYFFLPSLRVHEKLLHSFSFSEKSFQTLLDASNSPCCFVLNQQWFQVPICTKTLPIFFRPTPIPTPGVQPTHRWFPKPMEPPAPSYFSPGISFSSRPWHAMDLLISASSPRSVLRVLAHDGSCCSPGHMLPPPVADPCLVIGAGFSRPCLLYGRTLKKFKNFTAPGCARKPEPVMKLNTLKNKI